MTNWVRSHHHGLSDTELARAAAEEFSDDREMVEWALGFAAKWERSSHVSKVRTRQTRLLRGEDNAPRILEFLAKFEETDGISYRSIITMTRPEGLAYCEREERVIAGRVRHITFARSLFEALPNDRTTPERFFVGKKERILIQLVNAHREVFE